jgi:hypothetical protein
VTLIDQAVKMAQSAIQQEKIRLGHTPDRSYGWKGTMRSISADRVPFEYMTSGSDFLWLPRSGHFKRRGGTDVQFSSDSTGLLPASWNGDPSGAGSGKCRSLQEFKSDWVSDNIPTLAALVTREAIQSGKLDDGRYSNFYVRDQVNDSNYTVGSEYDSTTYPSLNTEATYKFCPLWHDSGDGGLTRGVTEFDRRFFFGGSRRFLNVGNWWYFPSLYGTPSRWNGIKSAPSTSSQTLNAASTDDAGGWTGAGSPGGGSLHNYVDEEPYDDGDYIQEDSGSAPVVMRLEGGTDPGFDTGHTFIFRYKNPHVSNTPTLTCQLVNVSDSSVIKTITISNIPAGQSSFTESSTTLSTSEAQSIIGYGANSIKVNFTTSAVSTVQISYFALTISDSTATKGRLIPSGPLPPLHAGTLTRGKSSDSGSSNVLRPDVDSNTLGDWLAYQDGVASGNDLYTALDETTFDNSDDIIASGTDHCSIGLSDPGFTISSTNHDVYLVPTINWTLVGLAGTQDVEVALYQGDSLGAGTVKAQFTLEWEDGNTQRLKMTDDQVDTVSDWTDVWVRFDIGTPGSVAVNPRVKWFYVDVVSKTEPTIGGWKGRDRFFYSVAYRFEDDSIWAPCIPRSPNTTLTEGYNIFTVNKDTPNVSYDKVVWSNIPIGPKGTKSRILLRTPKIDSTVDDDLQLNSHDLRVVWEIKDNTTTTYDDFFADDDSLGLDADRLLIRDDLIMPPRARYIFGGDMRIGHSYGGLNPVAIILAPVGRSADYDLNSSDDTSALYDSSGSYFRLEIQDGGSSNQLVLGQGTGAAFTAKKTIDIDDPLGDGSTPTLQAVVDIINDTSFSVDGAQWRAQVAPGANPEANPNTALLPNYRTIASCVTNSTALTNSSGGLSKVAVGARVNSATGCTSGQYVVAIVSDTELTLSSAADSDTTEDTTFYFDLGDDPTGSSIGYQRVISNSLPGFLYFNKTYLDTQPIEKNAIWTTVASPGANKSAPNLFSGKIDNKHVPPLDAGISMGGAAVDNGFVVPFSKKNCAIRNTRDSGTGLDSDMRLFIMNEARGCVAWNSIGAGSRFVHFFSPEGMVACDLYNEMLISTAIYDHATNTGDFDYEGPLCVAAAAIDNDTAYLSAQILKSAIWVNYRNSNSVTEPDRQVVYDYSSGQGSGLRMLVNSQGEPWGWSTELNRTLTCMTEGRRNDGVHLYGWDETNGVSTDGGRIEEIETSSTTDNTDEMNSGIRCPWIKIGREKMSCQEVTIEHATKSTSTTVSLKFHRSYSDDSYTLTPTQSDTLIVIRDEKMLTLPARTPTAACYLEWLQTAGTSSEIRGMELRFKPIVFTYK